ncbi:integrase [Kluyvera ascorbata]|uniref:Integrase n=1 Tax=Kluyvera ascorbata TaxID=51288 RepID=A0A3N2RS97_9ENTR|nr:integrase [Kluyvera ascorbata]
MSKKRQESVNYDWSREGAPPIVYEQRSLSERLYHKQRVNTQILMGHASQEMADRHSDSRGKKCRELII